MEKKPRRKCLNCEEECKRATTKFCSKKCEGEYRSRHNIRRGGPKRKLQNIKCLFCNDLFRPIRKTTKFCSRICAAKHNFHIKNNKEFMFLGHEAARNMSPERRAKLARVMSERNKAQGYTKGIGGIRKDLGHYVRSRWEANICRLLKHVGISYLFEPDFLPLSKGNKQYIYIPDIKIAKDIYIEVKGWETHKAKIKRELMKEQYPQIEIIYIKEKEYKEISKRYKDHIPNWEYDKKHGR